uniref:DUF6821 domain-containing protein n=1 Tax=Aegilops tauschii TaxID=37682 RepID=M8CNH8_AEGTA
MEGGGVPSVQDVWDWEVLPDEHRSFYAETRAASRAHAGGEVLADHETEEPILPPPSQVDADNVDECKDIGVARFSPRIQQVVQQTSRLNQAMSSMMGAGASTRANISFGGFYDGF